MRHILTISLLTLMLNSMPAFIADASARIELIDVEAQQVKISFRGNVVCVTGAIGKTLHVYNLIGMEVMTVKIDSQEKYIDLSHLPKGAYPVKVGNVSKKINLLGR